MNGMIDIDTITRLALENGGRVNSLRELILILAMQGKLEAQNPNDETAETMLLRIREKYLGDHKAKKSKKKRLPDFKMLKESDHPHKLPNGWAWVKLSSVGDINPRSNLTDKTQVGFVSMSLIQDGYVNKHSFQVREWSEVKRGYTHFQEGDVGVAKITPCFENRKSCVFQNLPNGKGAGTTELYIFRDSYNVFDPDFLVMYFKTESFISNGKREMTGTAGHKRIPRSYFAETPMPLPPLAEQKRITAKLKKLMKQHDLLDEKIKEKYENNCLAHVGLMKLLLSSSNADAFATPWKAIHSNFDLFYSVKENVEELKKAILILAMQGRLVRQDPTDDPAVNIVKTIRKIHPFKKSQSKRATMTGSLNDDKDGNKIPTSWVWSSIGDIAIHNTGKTLNRAKNIGKMRNYITTSNLYWGHFELGPLRQMPIEDKEMDRFTAIKGDLLICEGGEAGRAAVWDKDYGICFQNHIHRVRLLGDINPYFVYLYFRKLSYTGEIDQYRRGLTILNMSSRSLTSIPIPLPPLEEQSRIVDAVEHLSGICDNLINNMDEASVQSANLLDAIVRQVAAL